MHICGSHWRFPAYPHKIKSVKQVEKLPFVGPKISGLVSCVKQDSAETFCPQDARPRLNSTWIVVRYQRQVRTSLFTPLCFIPPSTCLTSRTLRSDQVLRTLPDPIALRVCLWDRSIDGTSPIQPQPSHARRPRDILRSRARGDRGAKPHRGSRGDAAEAGVDTRRAWGWGAQR